MNSVFYTKAGFTLVELLVAVAVVGLIIGPLTTLFLSMTQAMMATSANARLTENLLRAQRFLEDDLSNLAKNPAGSRRYMLRGIDNDGNVFRDAMNNTPGPGDRGGDRIHFHRGSFDKSSVDCNFNPCAPVNYIAYWTANTGVRGLGLNGRWGLARRKIVGAGAQMAAAPGSTVRFLVYGGGGGGAFPADRPPNENLTAGGHEANDSTNAPFLVNHDPVAFNVDYLSIRYRDPAANAWVNCWNTRTTGPAGCPPADGRSMPDAIQVALRGYDKGRDLGTSRELLDPIWTTFTVSLK